MTLYSTNDSRRRGVRKDDLARKHLRNEKPHDLPEQVAQWNQVHKPQRLKWRRVLSIFQDLAINGVQVGQQVAMRNHYAFRITRCAGSKDDFQESFGRWR